MRRAAAAFALLSQIMLSGATQQPGRDAPRELPAGSATIRGRVVADGSDVPLRNARVTIRSDAGGRPDVYTDAEGRFSFTALPAGRYILVSSKSGYATMPLGARRYADRPKTVDLGDGEESRVEIHLPKGGAITGRVVDDLDEPLVLAAVAAQTLRRIDGRLEAATVAIAETDDLGEYRLGALPPGRYIVGLLESSNRQFITMNDGVITGPRDAMLRSYYPAARGVAEAQPIRVRAGEEIRSVDLTARSR